MGVTAIDEFLTVSQMRENVELLGSNSTGDIRSTEWRVDRKKNDD